MADEARRQRAATEAETGGETHGRHPLLEVPLVGVGASAGGLSALARLLGGLPADPGLTIVVVMHLAPDHESHLAPLLRRHVAMPVEEVGERVLLRPNRIYVVPPGAELEASGEHLCPHALDAARQDPAPVDRLFHRLAEVHGVGAVGVILTGSGCDGAAGLRRIYERGGLTFVQAPEEAEEDGMPRAALAAVPAARTKPLGDLAKALASLGRKGLAAPSDEVEAEGEAHLLDRILALLREGTGDDFDTYRRPPLLRRVRRRMENVGITHLRAYLERLRSDGRELAQLRDALAAPAPGSSWDEPFQRLAARVAPSLFEGKGPDEAVRVWTIGCATGEATYAVAMALLQEASRRADPPAVRLFGTCRHEGALRRARAGTYPADALRDPPPDLLRRFFRREDDGWRVSRSVRECVVFARHDLLADPPFTHLDLVVCRGHLSHLSRESRSDLCSLLHYALLPGGLLVLGADEAIDRDLFLPEDAAAGLWRRRSVPRRRGAVVSPVVSEPAGERRSPLADVASRLDHGALHEVMLERYAPPSVLVDPGGRVVHASATAGRYLALPGGQPTRSVFKLVRPPLAAEVRATLAEARASGAAVRSLPLRLVIDGDPVRVALRVESSRDPGLEGFALVFFEETADPPAAGSPESDHRASPSSDARELAAELDRVREALRQALEEGEVQRERTQGIHEELLSVNEELRVTLDEVAASRQVLQSMNEELLSLQEDNRSRVEQLARLSTDLQHLLDSTQIAMLHLDCEVRVARFTPRITNLFNLRLGDEGRPLAEITHALAYPQLHEDIRSVIAMVRPMEREIQTRDGRRLLVRLLPYQADEERMEGVVLTFIDVHDLRTAQERQAESERRYKSLFEAIDEAFCIVEIRREGDAVRDFVFVEVNPAFHRLTGLETAVGRGMREMAPDHEEYWFETFGEVARTGEPVRFQRAARALGRVYDVYAFPAPAAQDDRVAIVFTDITDRVEAERALRESRAGLERRVSERTVELQQQALRLRAMARELSSAEQRERRRLAGLLHDDLQQVLFAANMRVQAVLGAKTDPPVQGALEDIREMLDHAVATSRNLTRELRPPALYEQGLAPALRWLGDQMSALHGLTVSVDSDQGADGLDDDVRALLYKSVGELLFNVVKHAGVEAARVRTASDDTHLSIVVEDDGAGFDVEAAARGGHRSGMGLFSVQERMAAIGGRMRVESVPGDGTRVELVVPREAWGRPGEDPRPGERLPEGVAVAPRSDEDPVDPRIRVLLVDDHAVVRAGVSRLLAEAPGLVVVGEAGTGAEALEKAEQLRPDVVLVDVNLPDTTGIEVVRRLRRRWPTLAAIGFSARDDEAVRRDMREAGAGAFVSKSEAPEKLLEALLRLFA